MRTNAAVHAVGPTYGAAPGGRPGLTGRAAPGGPPVIPGASTLFGALLIAGGRAELLGRAPPALISAVALNVTLPMTVGPTVTVAVIEFGPSAGPSVQTICATPEGIESPVTVVAPYSEPPPDATAHAVVIPLTGFPA